VTSEEFVNIHALHFVDFPVLILLFVLAFEKKCLKVCVLSNSEFRVCFYRLVTQSIKS